MMLTGGAVEKGRNYRIVSTKVGLLVLLSVLGIAISGCANGLQPPSPSVQPTADLCRRLTTDDFPSGYGMDGRQGYRDLLDSLINRYGQDAGLTRGDVRLYAVTGITKTIPGQPGVVAGEIACYSGPAAVAAGTRFQIILYTDALVGAPYCELENAIAHEFKHILQVEEHNLSCLGADDLGSYQTYEAEARYWADLMGYACDQCPGWPPHRSPPPEWSMCEAAVYHGQGPHKTTCTDTTRSPPLSFTGVTRGPQGCENIRTMYNQPGGWNPGCSPCVPISCSDYAQTYPHDDDFLKPWCDMYPDEIRCEPGYCDSVPNDPFCP
jgi:hypothetical protein